MNGERTQHLPTFWQLTRVYNDSSQKVFIESITSTLYTPWFRYFSSIRSTGLFTTIALQGFSPEWRKKICRLLPNQSCCDKAGIAKKPGKKI